MDLKGLLVGHQLDFIRKEKRAQNAYTFVFSKPDELSFRAGQHFTFSLPHEHQDNRGMIRIFTIASAPQAEEIHITTRFFGEESSSFKKALMKLQEGDEITARGPSPLFDSYKIKDYTKYYLHMIGGIGVTPFHSVLRDSVDSPDYSLRGGLFYMNKDEDFIYDEEITEYANSNDDFFYEKVISPERLSASQMKAALERDNVQASEVKYLISGTPGFVKHYKNLLKEELGIKNGQIGAYQYTGLPFIGSYE